MKLNDLDGLARKSCVRLFERLSEDGCEPILEDDGLGVAIYTENGSAELLAVAQRGLGLFGEVCLQLVAAPGEGKDSGWLAECLADEVINLLREDQGKIADR